MARTSTFTRRRDQRILNRHEAAMAGEPAARMLTLFTRLCGDDPLPREPPLSPRILSSARRRSAVTLVRYWPETIAAGLALAAFTAAIPGAGTHTAVCHPAARIHCAAETIR
jgi:hypothetical protein